jgi:TatD DNase family protein
MHFFKKKNSAGKMTFIDTHAHLYAEEFDSDRTEMLKRSIQNGVSKILLPNIDSSSIEGLLSLQKEFPENCFPMMGLHPCSVNAGYKAELEIVRQSLLSNSGFIAVGEIGMDLYWDKTFQKEQEDAFILQCEWAIELNLPIAIHTRNAHSETVKCLHELKEIPRGVFHCFGGTIAEANEIIELGFKLGIGGIVTYKNSKLPEVLRSIAIEHIIMETDSPYLPPVPYRGKRNESSYIPLIADKLAEIYELNTVEIAKLTTANAESLFKLNLY